MREIFSFFSKREGGRNKCQVGPSPISGGPLQAAESEKERKKSVGRRATFFPFEKREGEPEKKATDEKKPAKKENQKTSRFKTQ